MAFIYSPKIVTDGLVLYLDAANPKSYVSGSTAWNDLSRGGNTATLTAATSSLNAIEFTRTNNTRATIPTLNLSSTNNITVDFWVNFKTVESPRIICELSDNYNLVSDSFFIALENGNRWLAADRGNVGYNVKELTTPLPVVNTWYNLTTIYDRNQLASTQRIFYLNGVNQTNINTTSNNAQNTNNFGNRIFYHLLN